MERIFATMNVQGDKRFIVMGERNLLAQKLWELKESGDGLSYKKLAARSGGLIKVSTLHGVMHGKSKELTSQTIAGIARILGISDAHVRSLLNNQPLSEQERVSEEMRKLWEMYSDIPRQCQIDVMDLLEVLQRNHSISKRQRRRPDRRDLAA
jgi:transcriptional regulator with XRE-family HTH domain